MHEKLLKAVIAKNINERLGFCVSDDIKDDEPCNLNIYPFKFLYFDEEIKKFKNGYGFVSSTGSICLNGTFGDDE